MKIAGYVLLYHPKENDLKNILSYLLNVDKLYVYDNTENKKTIIPFENHNKIVYFSACEIKGLSFRLNQASKKAIPMVLIF